MGSMVWSKSYYIEFIWSKSVTGLLFKLSEFVCPLSLNGIGFDILFVRAVTAAV